METTTAIKICHYVCIPFSNKYLNYIKYISTVYLTFCKINLTKKKKNSHDFCVCVCVRSLWSVWYMLYKIMSMWRTSTRYSLFRWWMKRRRVADKWYSLFLHGVFRPSGTAGKVGLDLAESKCNQNKRSLRSLNKIKTYSLALIGIMSWIKWTVKRFWETCVQTKLAEN